jgi:antitoxin VapB
VRLFRNGRSQALRIPREFEFDADEVTVRRDGERLIVEAVERAPTLAEVLATIEPIDDEWPELADPPPA